VNDVDGETLILTNMASQNISIFEFDSNGNHNKTTNINHEGELKIKLKKHELVIYHKKLLTSCIKNNGSS
jgi:hypothetical protein